MPGLFSLVITLLILGLIVWLIFWIIDMVPLPAPFGIVIKAIIGIVCLIYLLGLLFGAMPYPQHWYRG
jgi:hypothetical protein